MSLSIGRQSQRFVLIPGLSLSSPLCSSSGRSLCVVSAIVLCQMDVSFPECSLCEGERFLQMWRAVLSPGCWPCTGGLAALAAVSHSLSVSLARTMD
ncbi:hypothetical protein GDO81_019215 [Engystomops pustulosus]|uniref:Secreted protein n=1 Tax=Engystomops pustulosus TaxID=76066 RepID=A0AAV6YHT3_ENGPU|nr:hypothetical protein GDO81_019215 [Engystomops pustulosus]